MRRRTLWVALLSAFCGTFAMSVQAASASTITASSGAGVYSCVSTASYCTSRLGTFSRGTTVSMRCWYDGRTATGAYKSPRWFLVRRSSDGYEGFVHSSWVGSQTKVGWCGDSKRVKAGLAATQRIGKRNASETADTGYWSWTGPKGEWSGDCKAFAYIMYKRAGVTLHSGNGGPTFMYHYNSSYLERGRNKTPRYGSIVGWNWNPGHIAVAIGGHNVATTLGYDGDNAPITVKNLESSTSFGGSNFYGWAIPKY